MCWKVEKPEVYCECLNGKELEPRTVTLLISTLLFCLFTLSCQGFTARGPGCARLPLSPGAARTHQDSSARPESVMKGVRPTQLPVLAVLLESKFQKELSYA